MLLLSFAASFAVMSGIGGAMSAPPRSGEITLDDAVSLVNLVARHRIARVKHRGVISIEGVGPNAEPGFYSFQARGWSPGPGSALIGNFSVDRHTAAVWSEDSCEVIMFTSLRELQNKILRRAGIDSAMRAHNRLPGLCDFSKFPEGLR
jgi:hypothetical protein